MKFINKINFSAILSILATVTFTMWLAAPLVVKYVEFFYIFYDQKIPQWTIAIVFIGATILFLRVVVFFLEFIFSFLTPPKRG